MSDGEGDYVANIGVSSVFGRCEGDLESVIRSLHPNMEEKHFGEGIVTYSFAGQFTEANGSVKRHPFMATVVDYHNASSCRQFNVAVTVTGDSDSLRNSVIDQIVKEAKIEVLDIKPQRFTSYLKVGSDIASSHSDISAATPRIFLN